jgi:hypothetical protein
MDCVPSAVARTFASADVTQPCAAGYVFAAATIYALAGVRRPV